MIKLLLKPLTLALLFLGTIFVGYLIYAAVILMWTPPKIDKKYDAIIVLTGAKGRIETGLQLLVDGYSGRLLISGVLDNVPFNDLIANNSDNLSDLTLQKIKSHCCIDLDYKADTTETNAIESAKWIQDHDVHSILLVTSALHMPRSYLLFHRTIADGVSITAYPYQPQRRLALVMDYDFWQYVAREYIKFGGNLVRLERQ